MKSGTAPAVRTGPHKAASGSLMNRLPHNLTIVSHCKGTGKAKTDVRPSCGRASQERRPLSFARERIFPTSSSMPMPVESMTRASCAGLSGATALVRSR